MKANLGTIMINGYKSVNEVATEWNLTPRRVRNMCANGLIEGAAKLGREWAIPYDAKRPKDKRVTNGDYRDWRK